MEQGKICFRSQDYGTALMLFEDARRARRAMYEQMERDFILLLSERDVRRIGDSLQIIELYARDKYFTAAVAAMEELFYRVPRESLDNSAKAALAAIGKLKDFPEAEYWIGEVYRVEGELFLALSQYRKAYELRDGFEDQGFGTVLQYKIAGILKTMQEYNEMERTSQSIITGYDTLWVNSGRAENTRAENISAGTPNAALPYDQSSASFMRTSMTRVLENEGIERFLLLYRYNNAVVEEAHRHLGYYYAVSGRPTAQHHMMFAFLIQNSIILEEVKRRQYDYVFTSLNELSEEIHKNPIILAYATEVEYYKTTYYLAASLFRNGRITVARSLWEFLASEPRAGEWYSRSASQLRNPRQEPLVEMP
jgi:tetratricopeptide (TPR) repeat protein